MTNPVATSSLQAGDTVIFTTTGRQTNLIDSI